MATREVKRPACSAHHPVSRILTDSQGNRNMRAPGPITLINLMVSISIVALLASVSIPSVEMLIQKSRVAAALADIGSMQIRIEKFRLLNNGMLPASLDVLGAPTDPWGNPYQYINIETGSVPPGFWRKDLGQVPVNSDYDLFSMGRDGDSVPPLTGLSSRDDIVRAYNGGYVGLAKDH